MYNKGVEDSKRLIKEKIETLELDIDSLLKKGYVPNNTFVYTALKQFEMNTLTKSQ